MLEDFKKWLAKNRHAYLLPVGLGLYLLLFFALDFFGREPQFILHSALDDLIPFNEWFAIVYFAWFAAFPLSLLGFLFLNKEDFLELFFIIFAGALVCFGCYLLLPTGLELRPAELPRDNLLAGLMRLIWAIDAPRNVCPSLHVSISVAIALVCLRSRSLRGKWLFKAAVLLLMALICVSTLFVKQHSAWDILAGSALSLALFIIAEAFRYKYDK